MPEFISSFSDDLRGYVLFKRSLGYKYAGTTVARLAELDRFLAVNKIAGQISEDVFEAWAARRAKESKANQSKRISVLNNFCRYLAGQGRPGVYVHEYPAGTWNNAFTPYIFTHEQISALFEAAKRSRSTPGSSHDADTVAVLLCLYYGCGLRKSEALDLMIGDVDLPGRMLRIMDSKNGTSRIVVTSGSVTTALARYLGMYCLGRGRDTPVFLDEKGHRFGDHTLYRRFHDLLADAGIPRREGRHGPRIHDLRHTFCVHTLEKIDEDTFDIYASSPLLSTFLGHKTLKETEYYLRLVEADFHVITDQAARHAPDLYPKLGDNNAR